MTTINIGGAEREIKYPFESVRLISKQLDKTVVDILSNGVSIDDVDTMIVLIWGGLIHRGKKLTVEMVSAWLDGEESRYPEIAVACASEYVDSVKKKLNLVEHIDEEDNPKN